MSLLDSEAREIENLVVLERLCSLYFKQFETLSMVDEDQFQTALGKRADRWKYEIVNFTSVVRSKNETQVYRLFKAQCDVDPFVKNTVSGFGFELGQDFEELDEDECDAIYKKIKDKRSQRGRGGR